MAALEARAWSGRLVNGLPMPSQASSSGVLGRDAPFHSTTRLLH